MAKDNYYTPSKFIESARRVMGSIELDPTSCDLANETVKATRILTIENSMFRNSIACENMFFNPPYSQPLPFVERVVDGVLSGEIGQVIGVLNTDHSTRWWREIEKIASAYCFLHDRIQFIDANNGDLTKTTSNNRPQFFFYVGANVEVFESEFSQYGLVLKK